MTAVAASAAEPTVYVNGHLVPRSEATVSVFDRGFLFADAVYEVIPVYQGAAFRLREHLARLDRSLAEIAIDNPYSDRQWSTLIRDLTDANNGGDLSVYLQVTRGAPAWREHWRDEPTVATVVAFTGPLYATSPGAADDGVHAVLRDDPRWHRCDIKATGLLPNVLARRDAAAAGAFEAIFHRDKQVTEGAATNVFALHGEELTTPPLDARLLPGVTRAALIEYLDSIGRRCIEQPVSLEQLVCADEVWLSSSTRELLPVTSIDGQRIGSARPGPVWCDVQDGFSRWIREHTGWL